MAGVLKSKKPLFKDEPALEPRSRRMTIREAEGGFIIGEGYDDNQKVCKTLAALVKQVKETFADEEDEDTDEDE